MKYTSSFAIYVFIDKDTTLKKNHENKYIVIYC